MGRGVSGYVNEVVHMPSGEKMAMKVVNLLSEAVSREHICRELNTLRFANCPSILDFYGASTFVFLPAQNER